MEVVINDTYGYTTTRKIDNTAEIECTNGKHLRTI